MSLTWFTLDGIDLWTLAVNGAAALVVASWAFLVLLGLVRITGRGPLARPRVRRVAAVAAFVGVLGVALAIWVAMEFLDGMRHFDDGIPPGDQALLGKAGWVLLVVGWFVGTLAAVWVGRPSRNGSTS